MTAVYAGDSTHAGSTSTALAQVVGVAAIPVLDERTLLALVIALAAAAVWALRRRRWAAQ